MKKNYLKITTSFFLSLLLLLQSSNIPYLFLLTTSPKVAEKLSNPVDNVSADYNYTATSVTVDTSNGYMGDYVSTHISDNDYMTILNTTGGLSATFTIDNVRLWNANRMIVMYDGSASVNTLAYEIDIYDYKNATWRNILPHAATYNNTTNGIVNYMIAPTLAGATGGGYIEIYDGYFSNGSNTAISTPLGNFVDNNQQSKIRFYSISNAPTVELYIDYLAIQATNSPSYYAYETENTDGGSITNEYNDTTVDDATTSFVIDANGSGIDLNFKFKEIALPYADANTYLIELSSLKTTITNYNVTIRDYTNSQWDALNATVLSATGDDTYYFALVPSTLSQSMGDYIQNGQMQIRLDSSQTSGSITVDYIRITLGSTATGSGIYTTSISRGTTSSGDYTNTRNLDTSTTLSGWIVNTSPTDARTTTEFYGDCNTAGNECASSNINLPVTPPENTIVQAPFVAYRFNTSSNSLDLTWSIRNFSGAYQDITTAPGSQSNIATNIMHIQELSLPMRPQMGEGLLTTIPTTFTPNRYIEDATQNAINLRYRTTASNTTPYTVTWDFAFASIKTLMPLNKGTHRWTAEGATLTYGTNNASNFRFTKADDTFYWNTDPDGTNGTDAYLSFTGVTIPTGTNKLVITSKHRFDVSSTYKMYIYDFSGTPTWRDITPHEGNFTGDATVANWDYVQLELFDGYFSDTANTKISTPLSNFVSGNEFRLRIANTSTTADLDWDFAQIQFVIGTGFFPSALTTTGSLGVGTEYNDLFTDDNTTNVTITPSGNSETILTFSNTVTPPEGFNAILLESSAWRAAGGAYDVSIKNVTTDSYQNIATGITRASDAVDYFIFNVGDWRNYIDTSGQILIKYTTGVNNNVLTMDFVQITLGEVPNGGTTVESKYGAIVAGGGSSLANLDTYNSTDELNVSNYLTVTAYNQISGQKAIDSMGGKEVEVNFPFHLDPGTSVAGLIFMYRGQTGHTTHVMTPSIQEVGGNFRLLTTALNFSFPLLAANAMPGTAGTTTINVASQTLRQGWYIDMMEDLWKSKDNRIRFRLSTTTGLVSTTDTKLIIDTIFFSYRWNPTETAPTADNQLRHGKWWNAGAQQKDAF